MQLIDGRPRVEGDVKIRKRVWLCAVALALPGMILLSAKIHAGTAQDVSCSNIELKYEGPTATTKCLQLDDFGNRTEAKIQRLIAQDKSYELILTYYAGKFHTYFPIRSLQQQVDDAAYFADTDNWLPEQKFGGFDVAVFNGFVKSGDKPTLCAAFSRYSGLSSGPYEYEGGTGYRNHTTGLYCAFSGQAALLSPPDNFYRLIESVIGKSHLPQ